VIFSGLLCLVAARDLSQLFQAWGRYSARAVGVLFGSIGRGRTLGIVGALTAAVIFLGVAWLVVPLALAIVMFYVVHILTSPAVTTRCGASISIPPGASLIAWLLIPTGIGTLPGIAMLTPKRWARQAGVVVLACLLVVGLLMVIFAGVRGLGAPADSSYLSEVLRLPFIEIPVRANALTVGAYGLEIAIACGLAIHYLQSRHLRAFYGA
jgi:hypothetical protein